jgi:nucleoside-diphosphate-sugar epimerase
MLTNVKVVIPGGAGLVGQNLIGQLLLAGLEKITVIDKHDHNIQILKNLYPTVIAEHADLSTKGPWENHFDDADVVVMLQAQIGGTELIDFQKNNVDSTINVISAMKEKEVSRLIHVSSSVVESVANDWYTNTKKQQEEIAKDSGLSLVILRPTLMFGWFDRKHLGWLSRFMKKLPVFPIPGDGRYMRQPLYAGDLSQIIISCINNQDLTGEYNISGQEEIDYIDIIKCIREVTRAKTLIVKIPVKFFDLLLSLWSIFDKNPPFTNQQLRALVAHDEFEVIDWPRLFDIQATPFQTAMKTTFTHPVYSKIVLEF